MPSLNPRLRSLDPNVPSLTSYILDLEAEVDRLRRRDRFLNEKIRERLAAGINPGGAGASDSLQSAAVEILKILDEVKELPEFHPADDRVVAIEMRPLVEKLFRYYQRISTSSTTTLKISLEEDCIRWFPSRLQHILDNLFSNAMKYRDRKKTDSRVHFQFITSDDEWYCIRLTDNGCGMSELELENMNHVNSRAILHRRSNPGVGLAVVKRLVEQCGGAISLSSTADMGTVVDVVLPRFGLDDYLT